MASEVAGGGLLAILTGDTVRDISHDHRFRSRVPLLDVPPEGLDLLAAMGGEPRNIHRALANQPAMLKAWVQFLYTLLRGTETPRGMRELMILRGAQLSNSEYEWAQHRAFARRAGVPEPKVDALAQWPTSAEFAAEERAALLLMEAMMDDAVTDEVWSALDAHFSDAAKVELVMTAGAYCMVPRILSALRVPLEG